MVRYKLNNNEKRILICDDERKTIYTWYPDLRNNQNTFIDILDRKYLAIKVRAFLPNGEIIVGWITDGIEGSIKFHNEQELFDGRFNSDRI